MRLIRCSGPISEGFAVLWTSKIRILAGYGLLIIRSARTDSRSLMYCVSIAHAVRNVARNNTSDGRSGAVRDALICLDVPADEFYLFIEETKCDEL